MVQGLHLKGYMGFPSTLCVSVDHAVVHGIPGDAYLKNGQIVGIDAVQSLMVFW